MPVSVLVTAAVACLLLVSLGIAVVSLLFPSGGQRAPHPPARGARREDPCASSTGAATHGSPTRGFFIKP